MSTFASTSPHVVLAERGQAYGQHIAMNVKGCDPALTSDPDHMRDWVTDLVDEIGMTAYGPALVESFGHADPVTAGLTVLQLIETSSIVCHVSDLYLVAYVDLFSCKDYDVHRAAEFTRNRFGATAVGMVVLHR